MIPGLCLVAGLAATCSFDASRLRGSPSPAADGSLDPDAAASGGVGDTAIVPDAYSGTPDTPSGPGGSDTPAGTGGIGGSVGSTEIGDPRDGAPPMGGEDGSDAPLATGGTDIGGAAGASNTVASTGGMQATAGSGDTGGDMGPTGGIGGEDSSDAGGSSGETDTGGVGGGIGTNTAGGAGSSGNASGGQTGTGGAGVDAAADAADTGGTGSGGIGGAAGTGGGGVDAATGAAGTGGNVCNGQCPLIATIGITGVWDYTYSNGTSGDVVTTGNNLFLAWLATHSANCTVENLDISGSNSLTAARLARYKVIVVLDIYHTQADKDAFLNTKKTNPGSPAYPGKQRVILASEANAVRDWVGAGGGLMTITGLSSTAAEMANVNVLLNGFLTAYSVTDFNVLAGSSTVTTFATAPPIASQITTGVSTLPVRGAAGIEGLNGGNLPPNSATFSQYATGGGTGRGGIGYAIGVAKLVNGAGHLNVWGDEWITYDSAWTGAYNASVQAYWNNVLTWLGQCP